MMNIKHAVQIAAKDRAFLFMSLGMIAVCLLLVIITSLNIRPSDIQVPVRYSSFSFQGHYTDKWYYLISFAVMGIAMLVLHVIIALKLYILKGRELAMLFLWFGIAIVAIAAITIYAIFRVALVPIQ